MKLFGGGTPQQPKKGAAEPAAPYQPGRSGGSAPGNPPPRPTAPKPVKAKRRSGRALVIVLAVTLAIIAVMFAAAAIMMRPPTLAEAGSKPSGLIRPEQNDATIHDVENGDEMELDHGDALDVDMGNRREGVYTVLVCATDIDGTRTDAIMVATLDTKNDTVNVINIPRDLMSSCNRSGDSKKINAAYGTRGGIETTKSDVKKALGFTPDKYVVASFNGIVEIIDALGGVDYEIPWRMKYDDPSQDLHIDFQPGMTHLDGQAAVEFMRWRKNNSGVRTGVSGYTGGDEQRIEKDQKFLKFLAGEVFTLKNVPRIPSLAQAVFSNVKTDLTAGEVLWLAWQLYDVKNENIKMMTLPGYAAMSYAGTGQMYSFYFANRSETLAMVNEFINPYEKAITSIDVITGPTKGSGKRTSSKPKEEPPEEDPDETDENGEERPDGDEDEDGSDGEGSGNASGSNGGNSGGGPNGGSSSNSGSGSNDGDSPEGSSGSNGTEGDGANGGASEGDSQSTAGGTETPSGSEPSEPVTEPTPPPADTGNDLEGLFAPGVTPEPPATESAAAAE